MPFYADQMFYTRPLVPWVQLTASLTGTGTAVTGAVTPASQGNIPSFVRRSAVTSANLIVLTTSALNPIVNFYNGTNAFLTGTIGTASVGQVVPLTVNTSFNTFTASSQPTGTFTGTATSAGTAAGAWTVWAETQELYQ
jgi:hypothetical protein